MPETKKKESKLSYDYEMAWKERQEQLKEEKKLKKISEKEKLKIEEMEEGEDIEEDDNDDDGILLDSNSRDYLEKSSKVKIIEARCRALLDTIDTHSGTIGGYSDSNFRFENLVEDFNNLTRCSNNLREWQKFQNSIIEYICNDVNDFGRVDFIEYVQKDFDKKTLNYLKDKINSFTLGTAKVEKLISKEQNSKDNAVKNKIIQNKRSQKD